MLNLRLKYARFYDFGLRFRSTELSSAQSNEQYFYKIKFIKFQITDPSRWQPSIETNGMGKFFVQQFVMPHNGLVRPYNDFVDVKKYEVGPHGR